MIHRSRVRMTGALVSQQDTIWNGLLAQGYAPLSARNLLRVAAHVSRWLEAEGLSPFDLTRARIDAFLKHRAARGYTCWLTSKGLEPILGPLRARGIVPPLEPLPEEHSAVAGLLHEYRTYLLEDRGVASATASRGLRTAEQFFAALGVGELPALRRFSAADVSRFVVRAARSMSVGSAKLMVTQLRSLLRFLHVRGFCSDFSAAAPAVAGHRLARLPKHIPWAEVQQLVESCDLGSAVGRRDHAVLLLLARLGLRAGEVAVLELGDVRWSTGEILIRGKGSHHARLPLPHDVGEAIVRYLKTGRPRTTSRRLFLNSCAPHGEISAGTIKALVSQASRRAHLPPRSAHQLRHTAATQMLRAGAGLRAVAEVLRHRSLDTTAIYAKVDHLALRPLARPWPGADQ